MQTYLEHAKATQKDPWPTAASPRCPTLFLPNNVLFITFSPFQLWNPCTACQLTNLTTFSFGLGFPGDSTAAAPAAASSEQWLLLLEKWQQKTFLIDQCCFTSILIKFSTALVRDGAAFARAF